MRKRALLLFLLFFSALSQVFGDPQLLRVSGIQKVMEQLFSYHIENRQMSPLLVRRSFKIYIEQFDPEKMYLLALEAAPFLQISDKKAAEIQKRIEAGNYADFFALNALFQRAVYRAEAIRSAAAQQLVNETFSERGIATSPFSKYASSEQELAERQKGRMVRFYLFHESRSQIGSLERKSKVFSLYERKMRRSESAILLQDIDGSQISVQKAEDVLATRILKAFAKSLDTHTAFFSAEEAHEMRMSLEKQFQGIGVVLSEGIDGVMIADLLKGSPADLCGKIQLNDLLVEIDGTNVDKLPFEEVLSLLKKKGREVNLGFKRIDFSENGEGSYYRVTLQKQAIVMNEERIQTSVEKFGDGVIGKIALHSFYEGGDGISSEKDVRDAIRSFQEHGPVYGIVLDLRENSGGFLNQAVKVAGLFISNGVVVISKYGKGEMHYLRNLSGRQFFNGPVVVLTSKMSASAAEIVAQALQDYGVGIVVGDERTFGKGSIQYQTVTDEKAEMFFKITVGRYYTVSGRSTQIEGVLADIVVPTQYAPYNIGERFLEYPLSPDSVDPAYVDTLADLDMNTQKLFQKRYLPYLQRAVPYWKRNLGQFQKNSASRLSRNPDFQAFLRRSEKIKARQSGLPANSIDEPIHIGLDDLQADEATSILKDMILMEAQDRAHESALEPTGS